MSHYLAIRGLLATNYGILNHGQVTWMTPELTPPSPNYHTNGRTFEISTDFTCIAPPVRRVFSGTGPELVKRPAAIRYLDHSATAATLFCLE
ncbi:hypothetical protein TNCV_523461 [Trichonephila clavipes]|nr:hypothetical protein TNCV_523461 [Trichonephila clavipes]